jgi:RHS repeat-associated protein
LLSITDYANSANPQTYYPFYDGNGNVVGLSDKDGTVVASYLYDPFGNELSAAGPKKDVCPFRFSTKYFDVLKTDIANGVEEGILYYGFRYYLPGLQRWLTRDPLQEEGGLNVYAFSGNDPINKRDALGLATGLDLDFWLLCRPGVQANVDWEVLPLFPQEFVGNPGNCRNGTGLMNRRRFVARMQEQAYLRTEYHFDQWKQTGNASQESAYKAWAKETRLWQGWLVALTPQARGPVWEAITPEAAAFRDSPDGRRLARLAGIVDRWGADALAPVEQLEFDRRARVARGEGPELVFLDQLVTVAGANFETVVYAWAATNPGGGAPVAMGMGKKGGRVPNTTGALPEGSFPIRDWRGYPRNLPKPAGPFRLLEDAQYQTARKAADLANDAMHRADPSLAGRQIHEIHPVKFSGSPTDPANKIPLTLREHARVTRWWRQLQRNLEGD